MAAPAQAVTPEPGARKVSVTIHVAKARYVTSLKAGTTAPTTIARILFGPSETYDTDVVASNSLPEYNSRKTFERAVTNDWMGELIAHPLKVTILEVEKVDKNPISFAEIDLSSFVLEGKTEVTGAYTLKAAGTQKFDDPLPDVQVTVTLSEALLEEEDAEKCNALTFPEIGLFSLPPRFLLKDDEPASNHPFTYTLEMDIPVGAKTQTVTVANGEITKDDGEQRIHWTTKSKVFLSPENGEALVQKLSNDQGFAVRVSRVVKDAAVNDENKLKYRAQTVALPAALAQQGNTIATGRFDVTPMAPPEPVAVAAPVKGAKPPAKPAAPKKGAKEIHPLLMPETDEEVHPYTAAKTYLSLTVCTVRPLVPVPKTPRHVPRPADVIAPRPKLPRVLPPANAATELQQQLTATVKQVLAEYVGVYGDDTDADAGDRVKQLEVKMTDDGTFHQLKEKLKRSIVRVVRDKFGQTSFGSTAEMDQIHSDLYVYLLDELHEIMSQTFGVPNDPFYKEPEEESPEAKFLRLAEEAELAGPGNEFAASQFHSDRISKDKTNPDLWYDYGRFALRWNDRARAEECFREAIAYDQQHLPSLIAYGCLLAERAAYNDAEVFINAAKDINESDPLLHALIAVLYDYIDLVREAKKANKVAAQLASEAGITDLKMRLCETLVDQCAISLAERALAQEVLANGRSVKAFRLMATLYTYRADYGRAEEQLNEALAMDQKNADTWVQMGHLNYKQGKLPEAKKAYDTACALAEVKDVAVHIRLGDVYMSQQKWRDAKFEYITACQLQPNATTWIGVGRAAFNMGELEDAEDAFAEANILNSRNPLAWAYLCIVCLRGGRQTEADSCFRETFKNHLQDVALMKLLSAEYRRLGKTSVADEVDKMIESGGFADNSRF